MPGETMIYTTGTIAVNGNILTGTGTNFTAAGSLIRVGCTVISMSSPAQVLQITAINSATQLTVTPAASPALPAGTRYAILLSDSLSVDGLAQDIAETLTLYQRNMSGFADVMNGVGDVTITTNGAAVTVPGQKSLAKKGANSDITSLSGLTTALSKVQGGTGLTQPFGSTDGTFCQGSDTRLNSLERKTGGNVLSTVRLINELAGSVNQETPHMEWGYGGSLTPHKSVLYHYVSSTFSGFYLNVIAGPTSSFFGFNSTGSATAPGSWISNSDIRVKYDVARIDNPLDKMRAIRGVSWKRLDGISPGIGFIAQEVQSVFPDNVFVTGNRELTDGTVIKDVLSPDTAGVAAALHHEAILALMDEIEKLKTQVQSLMPPQETPVAGEEHQPDVQS